MKKFLIFVLAVVMTLATLSFVGCSSNDNQQPPVQQDKGIED